MDRNPYAGWSNGRKGATGRGNSLLDALRRLLGGLAPRPTPVPVPIPVRIDR